MFNEEIPDESIIEIEHIERQIQKTFNRNLKYVIYGISDQKEEFYGFFYENYFKIPFVYRKGDLTTKLGIEFIQKKENIFINEFLVKEDFNEYYLIFLKNIFKDDSISGFLDYCYLLGNNNQIKDDKSADMIITIKENGNLYYDFFCQHNKNEEFDLRVKFHAFKEKHNNSLSLFYEAKGNFAVTKNKSFFDCFTDLLNLRFELLNYKINKENIDLTQDFKKIIHTIEEMKKIDNTIQY